MRTVLVICIMALAAFCGEAGASRCHECVGKGCHMERLAERKCPVNSQGCITIYSKKDKKEENILLKNCSQPWISWRDACQMVSSIDQLLPINVTVPSRFPDDGTRGPDSTTSHSTFPDGEGGIRRRQQIDGYVCNCDGDLCNSAASVSVAFVSMGFGYLLLFSLASFSRKL
ncbi:unnamed protein product [Notodromas monacha]|uniref:Protein quiver n=1 Tax=Notodromas monacha TaxID=399045 RepID=A0A7R9BEQ9_9CRUS|nr:unnamed protein product [Notodromas monacha]CAG0914022.1 unnamed protein product [Notodromas monacha]